MSDRADSHRGLASYLRLFLKGMAMGAADSVPGVSGGTIAVIVRIYDELIFSIRSVNLLALQLLFKKGFMFAWIYINGTFLLVLFLGILSSLILSANLALFLLENYFEAVMAFFIGLVIASSWLLKADCASLSWQSMLALIGGIGLTLLVSTLAPQTVNLSLGYLFLCGMVAICAMILPGLSGAFLLLLLGAYDYMLSALLSFDFLTIAVFFTGCVSGLILFSRLLAWMLSRYRGLSYSFLTGMLLASVYVLWPWQQVIESYTDSEGQLQALQTAKVLPGAYQTLTGQDPQLMLVLLCTFLGGSLIFIFDKLFRIPVD